ncbi:hypothetical protein D3C86_1026890 [compost metagenome]
MRLDHAVELGLGVADAADHGADVARARIDRDDRALAEVHALAVGGDGLAEELFGLLLDLPVDGRADPQAAAHHHVAAVAVDQLVEKVAGEVGSLVAEVLGARVLERHLGGGVRLGLGDEAGPDHAQQGDALTALGERRVLVGRVAFGTSQQERELCAFGEGQLLGLLAEVVERGSLDAVAVVAPVDLVQVHLQDLGLGVAVLDLDGKPGVGDLAPPALVVGQKEVLGELLRDGARALGLAALGEVREGGAGDALEVDAVVVVEAVVLDGDDGLDQGLGDLAEGHDLAVLLAVDVGEQVPLGVVDPRGFGGNPAFEGFDVRQA